jgi:hypothetical protein
MYRYARYYTGRVRTSDKTLGFEYSSKSTSLNEFLVYFTRRCEQQKEIVRINAEREKSICTCGVDLQAHWTYDFMEGDVFTPFSDDCLKQSDCPAGKFSIVRCPCGLSEHFHEGLSHKFMEDLDYQPAEFEEFRPTLRVDAYSRRSLSSGQDLWYTFISFLIGAAFVLTAQQASSLFASLESKSDEIRQALSNMSAGVIRSSVKLDSAVDDFLKNLEILRKVNSMSARFVDAVKRSKWFLGLVGISAASYAVYRTFFVRTFELASKVVLRENTDLNSLVIGDISSQPNFPQDLLAQWNVKEAPVAYAIMEKSNVLYSQLSTIVESRTHKVKFRHAGGLNEGHVLELTPQWLLTNLHFVKGKDHFIIEYPTITDSYKVPYSASEVFHVVRENGERPDVVLLENKRPTPGRELLSYWIKDFSVMRQFPVTYRGYKSNLVLTKLSPIEGYSMECVGAFSYPLAITGDCGSVVIGNFTGNSSVLVGIISAKSGETTQICTLITQKEIISTMERSKKAFVTSLSCRELEHFTSEPPEQLSQYNTLPAHPNFLHIGRVQVHGGHFKTSIRRSLFYDDLASFLSEPYSFPKKTSLKVNGEYMSPFKRTFLAIPRDFDYSPVIYQKASDEYFNHVSSKILANYPDIKLSPLSFADSIFGDPLQGVLRRNFKSSLGFIRPNGAKTMNDLFYKNDESDLYEFHPGAQEEITEALAKLKQGELFLPVCEACIKDEVRTLAKVEVANLRLFYTVDWITNCLARMYLAPLFAILLCCPEISYLFGKMNVHSSQGHDLAMFLRMGDSNWFKADADQEKYDIKHPMEAYLKAAEGLKKFALSMGYDEESADVVYFLIYAMSVKLLVHKSDVIVWTAGMPSGWLGTLCMNGIWNVLGLLYSFQRAGLDPSTFWDLVKAAIQGDDNACSIHISIASKFNLVSIEVGMRELGYKITTGAKGVIEKPFVNENDLTFLKRSFRVLEGRYVLPLAMDSIVKMLCFFELKGSGASETEVLSQCLETAQREFFFMGPSVYAQWQDRLKTIAEKHGVVTTWFTYDYLLEVWRSNKYEMSWL